MSTSLRALCATFSIAATTSAAFAQAGPAPSGVTIYGVADTGVEYITNVGAAGSSLTRMPTNTASSPSRLGFRGSEDLGNGLRALFTLESQIALDSGQLLNGGRGFGRQAWVGLAGGWGTVALGRQNTMLFWSLLDADILGPNAFGSGSLDSYLPNARADNIVSYRGSFSGFTLGATYSTGRDAVNAGPSPAGTNCPGEDPNDSKACRQAGAMLKYDAPDWGVALVTDRLNGGPGAFAGLVRSELTDTRTMLNGWARFGSVKLGSGLLRRDNEGNAVTPRSDLVWLGAAWTLMPTVVLDGQVYRLDFKNSDNEATLVVLRASYLFSRRTAAYLSAGHIGNDGTLALSVSGSAPGSAPAPGGSQTGLLAGIRHVF